jgi:predicted NAD-dependent protein-ADP-ribosyltransferase YbiA (DUF1768 family)
VASNSSEAIGKKLSNFAERRFVLDGKHYNSVEGWYQGLKWPEKRKRAEIAKLTGPSAKRAGKGAKFAQILEEIRQEFTLSGRSADRR